MRYAKPFLALLALLILLAPPVRAQGKAEGEAVKFKTVDGVTIKGKFYKGENTNAPIVMLLHNLNEASKKKNWLALADQLQKKGYAVLTFDFRGHGDSTTVEPKLFWSKQHPFNLQVPGWRENAASIDNGKFDKKYLPALVNDIAAAKAFLDRKNDAKECNSSRIIVIGAETGATLGAIWLKSEWNRYNVKLNPMLLKPWPLVDRFGRPKIDKPPEGSATICAVWLSISPKLGDRPINLSSLLSKPAREEAVPMIFMHSDGDKSGKTLARDLEKNLVPNKKNEKYRFTAAVEVKNGSKLKGSELLQKKTIDDLLTYLDDATKDKGEEWMEREFRRSAFIWWTGVGAPLVVKIPDDMNLIFSTYDMFLR